jgi:hypothetical protein
MGSSGGSWNESPAVNERLYLCWFVTIASLFRKSEIGDPYTKQHKIKIKPNS